MERIADAARLARLRLSPEERQAMNVELEQVLAYMEILREVECEEQRSAVPTAELRQDAPQPSLPRQELLANAPEQDGAYFLVPQVMDV